MVENLVLNMESKGFWLVLQSDDGGDGEVCRRSCEGYKHHRDDDDGAIVESLERPRKVMIMVKAGKRWTR